MNYNYSVGDKICSMFSPNCIETIVNIMENGSVVTNHHTISKEYLNNYFPR